MAIDRIDSNILYAATNGTLGRYVTSDGGATWTFEDLGFPVKPNIYTIQSPQRSSEDMRAIIMAGPQIATFIWDSDLDAFPLGGDTTVPLTDNLEAFWELEEASGTRVDSAGANDLADQNTVTQAVGRVGNAAQFTAANTEYLDIADNASLSMGDIDFTIAGWIYLDSKQAAANTLVSKWSATTPDNQREYIVEWFVTTDTFRFVVSADGVGSAAVNASNLGSPALATWYLVIAWHDATANTINIQVNNGIANSAAHTTGVFNGTAVFALGAEQSSLSRAHDGRIDQVGIWKRVLTAAERDFLFNGGAGQSFAAIQAGLPAGKKNLLLLGVG